MGDDMLRTLRTQLCAVGNAALYIYAVNLGGERGAIEKKERRRERAGR